MLLRLKHRILPLAGYEMLTYLRGGSGLAALVLCFTVGMVLGAADGATASLVAYRLGRFGAIGLGFLALPLLAAGARRDYTSGASDVIQSRPQQAHELMLARWLGGFLFLLALQVAAAVAAFVFLLVLGDAPPDGTGPRASLLALGHAILVGALPLLFLSVIGYCVADLLQNVLAAAIIALYWLLVLLGRDYLSRVFDFSLTQNALAYVLISAGVLFAAMAVARYRQKLANYRRLNVPVLATVFLVAGLAIAVRFVLIRHDPPLHLHPVAIKVASQTIRGNRLPGFWLPDQFGKRVQLADYAGAPLVVGFWSPAEPESLETLRALALVHRDYGPRKVGVIGICISDDMWVGRRVARERGYEFPMVTDSGTHWAEDLQTASPLTEAYEVNYLPAVFVADGGRNLVRKLETVPQSLLPAIRTELDRLLGGVATGAQGRPES